MFRWAVELALCVACFCKTFKKLPRGTLLALDSMEYRGNPKHLEKGQSRFIDPNAVYYKAYVTNAEMNTEDAIASTFGEKIVRDLFEIPRRYITPIHYLDDRVIHNCGQAHLHFQETLDELMHLFSKFRKKTKPGEVWLIEV